MAIYKLDNLFTKKSGDQESKYNYSYITTKGYPVISAGINIKGHLNGYNRDGVYTCISSSGANAGHITIMNGRFFAADCFTLETRVEKVIPKYGQYLLITLKQEIKGLARGSAQPHVYWKNVKSIEASIPSLLEQQKIIDIIEPFEHAIDMTTRVQIKLEEIRKLSHNHPNVNTIKLMNKNCTFIKGLLPVGGSGSTPFLNVAAINGKVNRWVLDESNVSRGDVMLSLDGTVGIVNNKLSGFNGYLYKVVSSEYQDYQIYYSLLARLNQEIINKFAFGTTIKHASRAKKYLYMLDIDEAFSKIYEFDLFAEKLMSMLVTMRNLILNVLV